MPQSPGNEKATPGERRELLRRLLEARAAGDELPVSSQQARLWVAHHLDPHDPSHNLRTELRVEGPIDLAAIERALARLLDRHEQLRATFHAVGGRPVARVAAAVSVRIERRELAAAGTAEREAEIGRIVREAAGGPFDLERGPLVRLVALELSPTETVLVLAVHHIVCDAWSMDVLLRELLETYAALVGGAPPAPSGPVAPYRAFAERQAEILAGPAGADLAAYWRRRLAGVTDVPLLPYDHPRAAATQMRSRRLPFVFPARLGAGVERLGRARGATTYMLLLAAVASLLHRLSGAASVVLATPVANRADESWEAIVGYFVNLLPMRIDFAEGDSFERVLARVRRDVLEAHGHQELPIHRIAEAAGLRPAGLVRGLFQHVAAPRRRLEAAGLVVSVRPIDLGRTHHDLSLTTWLGADGPAGILEYASELLEVDSAARWLADFEGVLHALVEDPAMPVGSLPVSVDWGRPRRAVPHPAAPVSGAARPRAAPSAPPESGAEPTLDALASIWRSVLELDEVAPFDNFLDVGGDSLLALQVIDRTETELGVRMAPGDLFTQTLAQLAASLEARRG